MDSNKMDEMLNAVHELRTTFEKTTSKVDGLENKFNSLDGMDQEKVNKINEALNKFESYNQELVKQAEADRTARENLEKKFDALSKDNSELIKALSYQSESNDQDENGISKETNSTFAKLIKLEREDIMANHKDELNKFEGSVPTEGPASNSTIRTDINTKGGYLVNPAIANKIFKEASGVSQIESFCSTFTTSAKSLIIPIDRDEETDKTYFVNEAMEGEEESVSYDQREITSYRQSVTVPITRDQLMFSDSDITSLVSQKVVDKLGKGAARAYLRGTAKNEPEGLMSSSKIKKVFSTTIGTFDFDDIVKLPIAPGFKTAYANPATSRYYFNLRTLTLLRLMRDSNGQYLWSPAIENKAPSTINGFSYAIVNEMDDVVQDKCPVLFGDLKQAYAILRTKGLTMIRDEYTNKKKAIIEFTWDRWMGGRIILDEAVRKLQISR